MRLACELLLIFTPTSLSTLKRLRIGQDRSDNEGLHSKGHVGNRGGRENDEEDWRRGSPEASPDVSCSLARATTDGTSFDFHTNQTNITGQSEPRLISMLE